MLGPHKMVSDFVEYHDKLVYEFLADVDNRGCFTFKASAFGLSFKIFYSHTKVYTCCDLPPSQCYNKDSFGTIISNYTDMQSALENIISYFTKQGIETRTSNSIKFIKGEVKNE